ncbi:hypothetical protein COCSADRAFT_254294 [Bipolaris sorokiniana ND90Pr]|uniref:Uncharacterized protein n=1 Tax=Cochliobolus sativus (strain ND90Pr / ATCC 201652) TaxID=665912 RepID=M2QXK2_COCSN|nr:uncharacterized protein COCSADRAFT_254294 [Bipolaris sorokiniana ND90Pr]EMD59799.1 hypothetical protein COCSADRAFT_254294 [Bipolaris sorokiniana ND90Pr]
MQHASVPQPKPRVCIESMTISMGSLRRQSHPALYFQLHPTDLLSPPKETIPRTDTCFANCLSRSTACSQLAQLMSRDAPNLAPAPFPRRTYYHVNSNSTRTSRSRPLRLTLLLNAFACC